MTMPSPINTQRSTRKSGDFILTSIITWFGCGLVPKAPGTMGTIGTLPLAWICSAYLPISIRVAFATFVTLFACWTVGLDQRRTSARDPQYVVIDETAGFLWSTAWLPARWETFAVAFLLFRLLDVLKPFPANFFDRSSKTAPGAMARGAHIVLDDVIAGWYSAWIAWLIFSVVFPIT